jgi:MFS family permease
LLLVWGRRDLQLPARAASGSAQAAGSPLAFLSVRPVWLCFGFFFLITCAFGAVQNFATPVLQHLYGLSLAVAASSLSLYLLGGAGGILLGGFLARQGGHEKIIARMLGLAAVLALLLASGLLPAWAAPGLMALIGFCTGIAGPSRDLLVRRVATSRFGQGAYGRIYGFVYSGLDAGLALAPLLFAGAMDSGRDVLVLLGIALLQGLAILTVFGVGQSLHTLHAEGQGAG